MNKIYKKELSDLKVKMEKAESFAEKLPVFSSMILEHKYTEDAVWLDFGKKYKDIYLGWGIKRGLFSSNTARRISNMRDDHNGHYFSIYINSVSLFDVHENFGLYESVSDLDVFFTDRLNSTFYVTDENITPLLERLSDWYVKARVELKKYSIQKEVEETEKKLARLKSNIKD
jgi:hypothetical protein